MNDKKMFERGFTVRVQEDTSGWLHTNGRLDPEKVKRVVAISRARGWISGPEPKVTPRLPWE